MVSPAAESDKPGCKDHPLFTRLAGYYISQCETKAFESVEFWTGPKKSIKAEGRFTSIQYSLDDGATLASKAQVLRNYENAIRRIGGSKVYSEDDALLYLKASPNGQQVWVIVNAYNPQFFTVQIVEQAAMQQEVVADAKAFREGLASAGHVEVPGILFDTNKADLKPESDKALVEVAKLLKAAPTLRVWIVGHTDATGDESANAALSKSRAASVVKALVEKHQIKAGRLGSFGAGPYAPVASNKTGEGRAKNRRVELVEIPAN
jgi:outer membrane protein OmpA-like peptidoglycan-associated protein